MSLQATLLELYKPMGNKNPLPGGSFHFSLLIRELQDNRVAFIGGGFDGNASLIKACSDSGLSERSSLFYTEQTDIEKIKILLIIMYICVRVHLPLDSNIT